MARNLAGFSNFDFENPRVWILTSMNFDRWVPVEATTSLGIRSLLPAATPPFFVDADTQPCWVNLQPTREAFGPSLDRPISKSLWASFLDRLQ
ncbi:hypothetical protein ACFX13_027470 [Malus domestica]